MDYQEHLKMYWSFCYLRNGLEWSINIALSQNVYPLHRDNWSWLKESLFRAFIRLTDLRMAILIYAYLVTLDDLRLDPNFRYILLSSRLLIGFHKFARILLLYLRISCTIAISDPSLQNLFFYPEPILTAPHKWKAKSDAFIDFASRSYIPSMDSIKGRKGLISSLLVISLATKNRLFVVLFQSNVSLESPNLSNFLQRQIFETKKWLGFSSLDFVISVRENLKDIFFGTKRATPLEFHYHCVHKIFKTFTRVFLCWVWYKDIRVEHTTLGLVHLFFIYRFQNFRLFSVFNLKAFKLVEETWSLSCSYMYDFALWSCKLSSSSVSAFM